MEYKWFFITLCVGIIVVQGKYLVSDFGYKAEAIKSGLEECPADPDSSYGSKTIFVKSCAVYIDSYYKHNKKGK